MLKEPDVAERLKKLSRVPAQHAGGIPRLRAAEMEKWSRVVKEANIKLN